MAQTLYLAQANKLSHLIIYKGMNSIEAYGAYAPMEFRISPEGGRRKGEGGKKINIYATYEINPGTATQKRMCQAVRHEGHIPLMKFVIVCFCPI